MIVDRSAMAPSTRSQQAVPCLERAVIAIVAHRPGAAESLEAALAHDPRLPGTHAVRGFAQLLLGREETLAAARGDEPALRRVLVLRNRLRREDRFERVLLSRLGVPDTAETELSVA